MVPERWNKVKEVLAECLERRPEDRSAYLQAACGGDPAVLREVESLVASHEAGGDLFERPPLEPERERGREGQRIGPYRVVREIGEGGMARVFLAVRAQEESGAPVAIKVVKRGMDVDFILRRFRNERHIMATLHHPNIARMLDGGTTPDGLPYFVMDYIEGRPIDEHCDARRLSVRERIELFRTVCAAVSYAHEQRIIHRDIKPGNILIGADGVPKLLDFGIAKMLDPEMWTQSIDRTATVLRLMTPDYASPEQVRGEPVSEATDIYSLGVLLYELLTGHRPYRLRGRTPYELVEAICDAPPERPSTAVTRIEENPRGHGAGDLITPARVGEARRMRPEKLCRELAGDLDNIILKAMRKEPARRYANVAEFSADLGRYLEGRPVRARGDTLGYRAAKLLTRHRSAALGAGMAAVLAAAAVVGAVVWQPWTRRPDPVAIMPPSIVPFTTFQGNETQPSFSPDGRKVVFVWGGEHNENSDIYVKTIATGELFRLTTDAAEDVSPAWSPDNTRIAFLRTGKQEIAVFVSPAGGGVHGIVTEVYPNRVEAVGRHIDWSADSQHLAVADKSGPDAPFAIYLVRADNGRKRPLTSPPPLIVGDTSPAFSPDGRWLSFLRSPASGISELWVARADGSEPRRLTHDNRVILSQTWTWDSRSIVFSSNRTGNFSLWQIAAAGGTPRRLPAIGERASEAAFSRDGRYMAYSQFLLDTNIWRVDMSGAEPPRPVISSTQYDSSPQYSPDGSRIAFRSNRTGSNEIWVADSDGRNPVRLTGFGGPITGTPRWSPDGAWIAFDSRPEGQADIFLVPSRGGPVRRVTTDSSEDVVPSFSRDGRWIYFASNRGGGWRVWKMPAEGGPKTMVTPNDGFAPLESPDGRWLYYARGRSLPGLYRIPVGGGEETPVLERLKAGYWGYWAASNDGVYFADIADSRGPAAIYFLRFRDRSERQLALLEKPLVLADSAFALAPDGRSILYTQVDQSGGDIMLLEPAGFAAMP